MPDYERIDRLEEEYSELKNDFKKVLNHVDRLIKLGENQQEKVERALKISSAAVAAAKVAMEELKKK